MSALRWTGSASGPPERLASQLAEWLGGAASTSGNTHLVALPGGHIAVSPCPDPGGPDRDSRGSRVHAVGLTAKQIEILRHISTGRDVAEPDWHPPLAFSCSDTLLREGSDEQGFARDLEVRAVVHQGRTAYQELLIVDTVTFGRCLYLDGAIQSAEYDEADYHNALVHPALAAHPHPRSVLIGGGGEGATLREVLRHPVDHVCMVDIDEEVVDACRTHMDFGGAAWSDTRTELVFDDFMAFLGNAGRPGNRRWDVIIVDITDAVLPGILSGEVGSALRSALNKGGIIGIQCGEFDISDTTPFEKVMTALRLDFPQITPYATWIGSYAAHWGFATSAPPSRFGPLLTGVDWSDFTRLTDRNLEGPSDVG